MKRLIREPLLHFILLGAALFAFDALRGDRADRPVDDEIDEIVVSAGRVENLAALFAKTWLRPPTADELRELVDDFVLEEALYREGKALGVDQGDTIIRRRVRQKMEFVMNDIIEQAEPADADLEAWLAAHTASYVRPARYRFRQIFLRSERRGDDRAADAQRVLAALRVLDDDADPRSLGDPSGLEHAFADVTKRDVIATFGEAFADGLATLPIGEWTGPQPSAFGLHLVYIDARTDEVLPALEEVRAAVRRDWAFAQRAKAAEHFNEGILARYRVVIEWPEGSDDREGSPAP